MTESRNPAERSRLASVLGQLGGECVYCGCKGDHCKQTTGERCELVDLLQARCNGVACEVAHSRVKWADRRAKEKREKREAGKRARANKSKGWRAA